VLSYVLDKVFATHNPMETTRQSHNTTTPPYWVQDFIKIHIAELMSYFFTFIRIDLQQYMRQDTSLGEWAHCRDI
jgi:hypothetical protein